MTHKKQRLAILGSTGSIGTQTLDIVRRYGDLFEVTTLTARSRWEALVAQAIEFSPDNVVIADETYYPAVRDALADRPVKVYAGNDALEQVVRSEQVDTVVMASSASSDCSRRPARYAAAKGRAGEQGVSGRGRRTDYRAIGAPPGLIIPVDSEHSAIFQCLSGERSEVEKVILTASGGPFLNRSADELRHVTVAEALAHPSWCMGAKVTIDSASLMNKGFEVIEARWLFGVDAGRIDVVIHPGSVVHSMVQFRDGAVKAQIGTPDMHLPIQYALTYPQRLPLEGRRLDFCELGTLEFRRPDTDRFPNLALAYECLRRGGCAGAVLNAANEVGVAAFLDGKIRFTDIARINEQTLSRMPQGRCSTLEQYRETDAAARETALSLI